MIFEFSPFKLYPNSSITSLHSIVLDDGLLVPKEEPMDDDNDLDIEPESPQPQIRVSKFAAQSGNASNLNSVIGQTQKKKDSSENGSDDITEDKNDESVSMWLKQDNSNSSPVFITNSLMSDIKHASDDMSPNSSISSPSIGIGQKSMRRRIRRKHNSPDDQAEALTEMSVRGLNLFRYASIQDGVYKCTECAKENVQKTFKNKYSFQRHAFLYHEGTQRKVFPCPVCRKEFSRPDKMKNHMKMTHECYMPKECKFPLPLIIAGSSQSTNNNILNIASSQ
jgi:tramtrack